MGTCKLLCSASTLKSVYVPIAAFACTHPYLSFNATAFLIILTLKSYTLDAINFTIFFFYDHPILVFLIITLFSKSKLQVGNQLHDCQISSSPNVTFLFPSLRIQYFYKLFRSFISSKFMI